MYTLGVGVKTSPDERNWGQTQLRHGWAGPWGQGWMRLGRDTGSALASLGRGLTAPGGCDGALGHGQDRGRPQGGGQGRSGLGEPSGPRHTGKAEPKCTQ